MIYNKKILAIVPARGGSKGIKKKNLKKIGGKSLIELVSIFINNTKFIDMKILSTDSVEIKKKAKKLEFHIADRPKKISGDLVSDYQVINHVLNLKKIKNKFDYAIYLQPTSPNRKVYQLKNAIKKVIKKNYDASWSITKINKKYHPLKVLQIIKKQKLALFNKMGKLIKARQQLKDVYIRNGVFYIFSISQFYKQKTIYMRNIYPSITNYEVANIDEISDLKKAHKLLKINNL